MKVGMSFKKTLKKAEKHARKAREVLAKARVEAGPAGVFIAAIEKDGQVTCDAPEIPGYKHVGTMELPVGLTPDQFMDAILGEGVPQHLAGGAAEQVRKKREAERRKEQEERRAEYDRRAAERRERYKAEFRVEDDRRFARAAYTDLFVASINAVAKGTQDGGKPIGEDEALSFVRRFADDAFRALDAGLRDQGLPGVTLGTVAPPQEYPPAAQVDAMEKKLLGIAIGWQMYWMAAGLTVARTGGMSYRVSLEGGGDDTGSVSTLDDVLVRKAARLAVDAVTDAEVSGEPLYGPSPKPGVGAGGDETLTQEEVDMLLNPGGGDEPVEAGTFRDVTSDPFKEEPVVAVNAAETPNLGRGVTDADNARYARYAPIAKDADNA